jgi:Domain of unknown function (DUF4224)
MLLTDAEIADLTRRTRHRAQAAALSAMCIQHKQRPDGSLVVLRAHVEHLLGGSTPAKANKKQEPDWGAINA